MKRRLGIALVAACMLLAGMGLEAKAIEVKVSGEWDFAFGWVVDGQFLKSERSDDNFSASQRFRTQIDFIASENLRGVLMFEIGDIRWGGDDGDDGSGNTGRGTGGRLDADGVNVETKRAYLDWMIPETDIAIRMGIQGLSLPMGNGWGNPVFSADVAGIVVSTPLTDMIGLTMFWIRPFDINLNDGHDRSIDDEMDMLGLMLPITGEGWKVTPWFVYADIGAGSGYLEYTTGGSMNNYYDLSGTTDTQGLDANESTGTHAWWLGTSIEVSMFDPLTFSVDAMYGKMSKQEWGFWTRRDDTGALRNGREIEMGASGWFIAAALNYEMDWGTPGIFGWWTSGDKESGIADGKYGRMPVVGTDDGFMASSFGFANSAHLGYDGVMSLTGTGTWGVGAQIANMSFIDKLDHTLRFVYYRGTNEHEVVDRAGGYVPLSISGESVYMTDKDNAYEINFDHNYQIYENLTATLELAYIYLDMEDLDNRDDYANNAWKAQLLFRYAF